MLYKTMTCALIAAVAANNAEVSTSNLRNGASFDNLKASWGKRFSVGDFDSQLDASYDYNANRDFLKDVKLSGNLLDGNGDDLRVGYEVTKNFDGGKSTELKLTAEMSGTKVCADLNSDDQLKEVSAQRSVAIGDRNVDVEPSFLVKAQTARVKLMSAFGKDRVKAQVDMAMGGENAPTYELGYERPRGWPAGLSHAAARQQERGHRAGGQQVRAGRRVDRQGERPARGRCQGRAGRRQGFPQARVDLVNNLVTPVNSSTVTRERAGVRTANGEASR